MKIDPTGWEERCIVRGTRRTKEDETAAGSRSHVISFALFIAELGLAILSNGGAGFLLVRIIATPPFSRNPPWHAVKNGPCYVSLRSFTKVSPALPCSSLNLPFVIIAR